MVSVLVEFHCTNIYRDFLYIETSSLCILVCIFKTLCWSSFIPSIPDLSAHARKEGEPGIQNHVTDVKGRKRGGS